MRITQNRQPIHGFTILTGHPVGVNVNGQLNAAVSQLFLDIRNGLAILNQQGGKGMSQIVEADTA